MMFFFFDFPEDKLEASKALLAKIGMPKRQQSNLCAYTLLALLGLGPDDEWSSATNNGYIIHELRLFINGQYGCTYAENTRESFRKDALKHFRNAAIVEDNGVPTNSPNYRYRITDEFLNVVLHLDDESVFNEFLANHNSLMEMYASKKRMTRMPVKINGEDFTFSTGAHNQLQKAIIEEFAPRFAPNCECLYVGDSDDRDLYKNTEKLESLGFEITEHDTMPDVVLYIEDKNWLYFIEAVTSVGPMNPRRVLEIGEMTQAVEAGKIFITAFPDKTVFKRFYDSLAWETEVWLANEPDHMIHLNGDKFMGPR